MERAPSDERLVVLARERPALFGELVRRYEAPLLRYIRRLGFTTDAEDILQEVFISAYKNLRGFDTRLTFSSWVYRIAHNTSMDAYRRRKARPQGVPLDDVERVVVGLANDDHTPQRIDAELLRGKLEDAIQTLAPKYRSVLVLRYFEERSYEEIADIMKSPVKTVGTLLHRAKKQLEKKLDRARTV